MSSQTPLRVVVAGLGNMGRSHALAYHANPGFEIAALINRSDVPLPEGLSGYGIRRSFDEVLRDENPMSPASPPIPTAMPTMRSRRSRPAAMSLSKSRWQRP